MRRSASGKCGKRRSARMLIAPPQGLLRGKRARSSRRTRLPSRASVRAAVAPAGPPPRTSRPTAPAMALPSRPRDRPLATPKRDEVREQFVRAIRAGRQLAPEIQAYVHPVPAANPRLDERAALRALVECKRVRELHQVGVPGVTLAEEVQPALLHPAGPGVIAYPVGSGERRVLRLQHRHRRVLVGYAVRAHLRGEGAVLCRVELELVVLHDDGATTLGILDQPVIARAQIGPALVRPHARDDGVE